MRVYLLDSPYTVTRSVWHMNATYKDSLFIRGIHMPNSSCKMKTIQMARVCIHVESANGRIRLLKKVILFSLQPVFIII